MSTSPFPDINYENAKRQQHEYFAPALRENGFLRVISLASTAGLILLGLQQAHTSKLASKKEVIVLQASQDGSLDRVQYVNMGQYRPGEKTVEHFAIQWLIANYSRIRAKLAEDQINALRFFSPELVKAHKLNADQTGWITAFLQQPGEPEVGIRVKKLRWENDSSLSLDFEKHFLLNGRELTDKMESWTTRISFTLLPDDQILNSMIETNPIGLQIVSEPRETKGL